MSVSGGLIYKPADLVADVASVLGVSVSSQNPAYLETLCKHANINKWARYKPVRYNSLSVISEQNRQSVKYGLVPYNNTLAETLVNISTSEHPSENMFNYARSDAREWTYNKPRGGSYNEQYRLTDFLESNIAGQGGGSNYATTNGGYYASSQAPLTFGSSWEIDIDLLKDLQDVSKVMANWTTEGSGSSAMSIAKMKYSGESSYQDKPSLLEYTQWDATFGSASSLGTFMTIPLNYILNFYSNNEDWRLGLIIWNPSGVTSTVVNNYADIVVSRHPLRQMESINKADYITKFSPDLVTNQVCAWRMYEIVKASSSAVTFKCIPVIVKVTNPTSVFTSDVGAMGSGVGRTYVLPTNTNTLKIYSIPTGGSTFTIKVTKADYTYGWKFMSIFIGYKDMRTGGDITSSTPSEARGELRRFCLIRETQSVVTYQITTVSCSYSYNKWDSTNGRRKNVQTTYTKTGTMNTSTAITVNGTTYGYGYIIRDGYEINTVGEPIIILHQ